MISSRVMWANPSSSRVTGRADRDHPVDDLQPFFLRNVLVEAKLSGESVGDPRAMRAGGGLLADRQAVCDGVRRADARALEAEAGKQRVGFDDPLDRRE